MVPEIMPNTISFERSCQIPYGSRDHVKYHMVREIMPNTVKITFNLAMSQKRVEDRIYSIVNNAGRALVKKLVLVLESNQIDTINNTDTYGNYKDL